MATVPAALTDRTPAQRWREVRDEDALWGDLRPELLEAVQRILEATMEDELAALLRAQPYERTHLRLDVRNGVYYRRLVTELGAITDLAVPRRRLVPYRPSFLRHAARRTTTVDDVLRRAFLRGLSTRETAALATTLTGVALSRGVGQPPRPGARRPGRGLPPPAGRLPGPLPASSTACGSRSAPPPGPRSAWCSPAYGIERSGQPGAPRLPPGGVRVGSRVAPAALARSSPGASTLTRSCSSPRTGRGGSHRPSPRRFPRPPSSAAGRTASAQPARAPCRSASGSRACAGCAPYTGPGHDGRRSQAYWRWARAWRARHPVLVRNLERDLDDLLAVFALPEPLRASLRTTNLIERAFRELRRRLRPIGSLNDLRSADRILYGQVRRRAGSPRSRIPVLTYRAPMSLTTAVTWPCSSWPICVPPGTGSRGRWRTSPGPGAGDGQVAGSALTRAGEMPRSPEDDPTGGDRPCPPSCSSRSSDSPAESCPGCSGSAAAW